MEKKITYLELLELIKSGKRPETVTFGNVMYDWEKGANSYMSRDGETSLMNDFNYCFQDIDAVQEKNIMFEVPEPEPGLEREWPEKFIILANSGTYLCKCSKLEGLKGGSEEKI